MPNAPIDVGELPDGSSVYFSANNVPVSVKESGQVSIYLDKAPTKGNVSISFNSSIQGISKISKPRKGIIANSTDGITISPNPCIISSLVTKCTVSPSDGSFSGYTTQSVDGYYPIDVRIKNGYLYVTNFGGGAVQSSVSKCTIDPASGNLLNCKDGPGLGFVSASKISFNNSGTIAYITNQTGNAILQCPVNLANGEIGACTNSGGNGFDRPFGMAIRNSN